MLSGADVAASRGMESFANDAGVLSETVRMGAQVSDLMMDHSLDVAALPVGADQKGVLWAQGLYADVDAGYEVKTTGFAFGADAVLPSGWTVGAAFSTNRGDLENGALENDIEAYGLSIYGREGRVHVHLRGLRG